jgi:predicted secreted protein
MKINLHFTRILFLLLFSMSTLGLWAQSTDNPDHACINSIEDYWVTNTPGSTYDWVLSGGGIITEGQGTSAIKINWTTVGGPYVLTVTETFTSTTGCEGLPVSLDIIVDPLPTPFNVTGTGGYCLGGTGLPVGLSDSELGVNYQLLLNGVNSGASIPGTGESISFGDKTIAGTYTVVATSSLETACTINMTGSAIITINPLPEPTIAGLDALPTNQSTVYTTEVGMSAYVWTISAGGTITDGGTATDNTVTVIWNTSGPQTVSVNYENVTECSAASATVLNVNVGILPVPTIVGPSPICVNTTDNVYETEAGMSNYIWTVSAGGTITAGGGVTDNTVTVTWNTATPQTVTVNYTNGGYTAASPTVKPITVDPLPITSPIWHN